MSNAYIGKIAAVIVSLCMTFFFNKELIAREIPTKTDLPANVAAVAFDRSNDVTYQFSGYLNDYLEGVSGWAKSAPERNQGMLDMLSDRERQPYRYLMPWGGEFVGKYLVGAAELYRLNKDPQLKKVIDSFVDKLQQLQAKNGYLGPWPEKYELTCDVPKDAFCGWADVTWDLWGHYHLMLGLTLWYQDTGNTKALDVACKIGDMLCDKYLGKVGVMAKLKDAYTNLSPGHSLFLLYKATNNKRYLDLAKQIIEEEFPRSVNHVNFALSGKEFYQNPFHGAVRWENAHELLGIAEMYWLTGEKKYRTAFEHIWWSIVKSDRYNTGTFASGEGVRGSPYNKLSKETCCAVAWEAMGVEMLRMTGNSVVADELELTFLNAVLAYQKRDGEWCTYDTPMDGIRFTRTKFMGAREFEAGKDINCCSAHAPRGFGMLSDWAVMKDKNGLVLNWYGASVIKTKVKNVDVTLKQETDYPRTGHIVLKISTSEPTTFCLKLRIPHWSDNSSVAVNGKAVKAIRPGAYLTIDRKWDKEITIVIELDMSLHFLVGEKECEGRSSIYYGPILLAAKRQMVNEYVRFDKDWGLYDTTYYGSCVAGAKFERDFDGDSILWIGGKQPPGGKAQVKIDGKEVEIIDQYAGDPNTLNGAFHDPAYWEYKGLGEGVHKIEAIILGEKNVKSSGTCINVMELVSETQDPIFDAAKLKPVLAAAGKNNFPIVELVVTDTKGRKVNLTDFDSAGEDGYPYISWFKVNNVTKTPFSKSDPLRSSAVKK